MRPYVKISYFLAETIDWRFWHDWFHDRVLARGYNMLTRWLAGPVDLGVIDGIANWLGDITKSSATVTGRLQTGYVRSYAMSVFVGLVVIISYLIFKYWL